MLKNQSLPIIKKAFFIGFSAFLFSAGALNVAPKSSASPGFFEYQWYPEEGYKKLRYLQSSSERLERATYYFFLRGKERKADISKLTLRVPDYFEAKIKPEKLSLCRVNIGSYTSRTRCLENVPSEIKINEDQTSIDISPEKAIPFNKDSYAVVMKIFNPRKRGMFQFQAFSQNVGEIDISTYLGTWNIDVQ
ncbi:DUF2808 domain-containing protein [Prochlorococcus sp. MIT 1011]|jgi:hypothetical protein|uniref:DUF2808 domain-containing protein n=1 Tax=Prochlorococcus sp. MIT 1011 TaxID=3082520 RepID=UPI0039B3C355